MEAMTHTSFADQLNDMWRTKPMRLPRRGPVAGVAAGFAQRYGVDPVLVRVAFVVSTLFGGAGLVLYLAAWLTFDQPDADGRGPGRRVESQALTVVLIVALGISAFVMGPVGMGLGGSGIISAALMMGAWWLLYLRQPVPPPLEADGLGVPQSLSGYASLPAGPPRAWTPPWQRHQYQGPRYGPLSEETQYGPFTRLPDAYEPAAAPQAATEKETSTVDLVKQPPSWDPLGAAPFAWDLPAPAPAPAAPVTVPRRRRSRWTPVFAGLALLTAGGTGAAGLAGVGAITPARVGAAALAVLALGMILGAFARRGFGLIALAAPVALFVWVAALIAPHGSDSLARGEYVTAGERVWTVNAASELQPRYTVTMGEGQLDLRSLKLTRAEAVNIDVRAGSMTLRVPADMKVSYFCSALFADAQCPPSNLGPGEMPTLVVHADVRFGELQVHRG